MPRVGQAPPGCRKLPVPVLRYLLLINTVDCSNFSKTFLIDFPIQEKDFLKLNLYFIEFTELCPNSIFCECDVIRVRTEYFSIKVAIVGRVGDYVSLF